MTEQGPLITRYEDRQVGDTKGWYWITSDLGAWNLPQYDWDHCHWDLIKRLVTNKKVAVQAGGNQGMYPKLLSHIFDVVYTWEPDPLNFLTLTLNCTEDNIIKAQAAVGDTHTMVAVTRHTMANVGMHTVHETPNAYIPCVTVDSYNIKDVGLIMFDTEGYEDHAVKGALETIKASKPVIFLERPEDKTIKLLEELGYKFACDARMDKVFVPTT